MPDNRTSQLLTASFKGVSFPIRSEALIEGGRKLILHEYINSDQRFVEDQGQIPPKFSITAFVHGVDFIARSKQLEQVLNEEGPGRLSMPVFGVVEAYAGAYTKDASQLSVGEITYIIPFFVGRPAPGPSIARTSIEDVYQLGDEARQAIEEIFTGLYEAPETSVNAVAAVGDLNNIMNDIGNTISTILPVEDLEKVLRIIDTVSLNAPKLVRNSSALSALSFSGVPDLPGLWQQISLGLSKATALGNGIEQLALLTNLGGGLSLSINEVNRSVSSDSSFSTLPLWPATTRQRIDRNTARQVIANANRVASLVGLYEVAAARSYTTDVEITDARLVIEEIHERIMRVETVDTSLIQSDPLIRSTIEDVRLAALNVLGQKEQEAFEIVTDNANSPTSVFVRSYLLYAEDFINIDQLADRTTELANLNTSQSSIALIREFKIFQV